MEAFFSVLKLLWDAAQPLFAYSHGSHTQEKAELLKLGFILNRRCNLVELYEE